MGASMAGFNPDSLTPLQGAPSVRNNLQVPTQAMGAMGAAVSGIGREAMGLAQQVQDRNDAAAVIGATAKLYDSWNQWNDPNNPDGAEAYKGANALGQKQAYMQQLDKLSGQINAGLTDNQRQAFAQQLMSFRASKDAALNDSMLRNHENFLQADTAASVQTFSAAALNSRLNGDEAGAEDALDKAIGAQQNQMLHMGASPAMVAAASQQIRSQHYAGVAEEMFNGGDPQAAIAYAQQHAGEMTMGDRLRVETMTRSAILDRDAEAVVAAKQNGTPPPAGTLVTQGAAQTAAQVRALAEGMTQMIAEKEGTAKNPSSSAVGFGQFIDSTWLQVVKQYAPEVAAGKSDADLLRLRVSDPALAKRMSVEYRNEIGQGLLKAGYPVTQQTVYLGLQFGETGAQRILSAPADARIGPLLDAINKKQPPGRVASINRIDGSQTVAAFLQSRGILQSQATPTDGTAGGQPAVSVGAQPAVGTAGHPAAPAGPSMKNADGTTNWAAMLDWASNIASRPMRARVMNIINEKMRVEAMTQRAQDDAMQSGLTQAIRAMAPTDTAPAFSIEQKAYMDAHPEVWDSVQKMVTQRRMQQFVSSDPVEREKLVELSQTAPNVFAITNFDSPWSQTHLSVDDRTRFKSMQSDILVGKAKIADWQAEGGQLKLMHTNLGIDGTGNEDRRMQFESAYLAEKQRWIQSHGGADPNADQRWGMMQKLALPVTHTGTGWLGGKEDTPMWKLAPGEAWSVPSDQQAQIVAMLKKKGVANPSKELVMQAYMNRNGSSVYRNQTPSESYVVPQNGGSAP